MAPKKFKMKKYEKDDDDHYIVIIEPWTHGIQDIADLNTVNYIAAWLRVMLRKVKEKGIIRAIYTLGQRREVIVQLSPTVDLKYAFGKHAWAAFTKPEKVEDLRRNHNVRLEDKFSYIFSYKWETNGDPCRQQWFMHVPTREGIPPNFIIRDDYPEPTWADPLQIAKYNPQLLKILLPLPFPPEEELEYVDNPAPKEITPSPTRPEPKSAEVPVTEQNTSAFQPYHRPAHMKREVVEASVPVKIDPDAVVAKTTNPNREKVIKKEDPVKEEQREIELFRQSEASTLSGGSSSQVSDQQKTKSEYKECEEWADLSRRHFSRQLDPRQRMRVSEREESTESLTISGRQSTVPTLDFLHDSPPVKRRFSPEVEGVKIYPDGPTLAKRVKREAS